MLVLHSSFSFQPSILLRPLLFSLLAALCVQASPAQSRPNIIFILADDLGWSDTTLYGGTKSYRTPNLERLAQRGMLFTRAYSASPLCSPTRASLLTGLSPARLGITAPTCHLPEVKLTASVQATACANKKQLECQSATRLDTKYFTLAEALRGRLCHGAFWEMASGARAVFAAATRFRRGPAAYRRAGPSRELRGSMEI